MSSVPFLIVALMLCSGIPAAAQGPQGDEGPVVGQGLGPFVFDGDLRSLPPADLTVQHETLPPHAPPLLAPPSGRRRGAEVVDSLVQFDIPFDIPAPILTFDGIPGGPPPDTNGVVGPNHYLQIINFSYAIWDKQGNQLVAPTSITSLFAAAPATGTTCDTGPVGDPVVLYDPIADRFILTALSGQQFRPNFIGPALECIAVSKTNNPVTGGWFKYALVADPGNVLNDFPKLGVWPDAYYMSANMNGCCGGSTFVRVWALDKSSILGGGGLNFVTFDVQSGFNSLLPSNLSNGTPPPPGTPNVFAAIDFNNNNTLYLWNFHVDWGVPANSTFGVGGGHTPDNTVLVAPYTHLSQNIPQPGTTVVFLDALGDRLNYPAQYRNIAGTQSLWVDHPVDTGGNISGIRWYEVHDPAGAPTLAQQGTWTNGNDGVNRWMGGIGVDGLGGMALGYNVSNATTVSPGIRYAGRLLTDPLGTLGQGEGTLIAGAGNLLNCTPTGMNTTCSGRWGDYSGMSVDPVDDCTFWFTGEYVTGGNNRTRIGNFQLPGCNADLSVTKTGPASIAVGSDLAYSITVTNNGPVNAQFVTLTDLVPLGTTFVSFTQNTGPAFSCTTPVVGGTGPVTCTLAALANGASATFTLVVHVSPSATSTLINTASVSGQELDPNTSNNSASAATIVIQQADLKVTKLCKPDTPIKVNQSATCTIVVENLGPGTARDVSVVDRMISNATFSIGTVTTTAGVCAAVQPAGGPPFQGSVNCLLGSIAPLESVIITVQETAGPSPQDINDDVTVTSSTPDPNLTNNQASGHVQVVALSADLQVTKECKPDSPVPPLTAAVCTIFVDNLGPDPASNVQLLDALVSNGPLGPPVVFRLGPVIPSAGACNFAAAANVVNSANVTCSLGTVAAGGRVTVIVPVLAANPQDINDVATVSSDTLDPDPANNKATGHVTITPLADLDITKTASAPVVAGTNITWTITVTNNGPSTAPNVVVTDPLPAQVSIVSVNASVGSCIVNPITLVTCRPGNLVNGASATITIVALVLANTPDGTDLANTACVASDFPDPKSENNCATATSPVQAIADLSIVKSVVLRGGSVTYTIDVSNLGPSDAQNVVVIDMLPATKFLYQSNTGGCTRSRTTLTCKLGTLGALTSKRFVITGRITSRGSLTNVATVSSSTTDPNSSNNSWTVTFASK